MSIFIKEIIKRKLNQITVGDLLQYGEQYGFSLTHTEAEKIVQYLKTNHIDPFNKHDRTKMFQALTEITDQNTAHKAQNLFDEMIHSYGLEHLFD
ncbi:MAG TPA: DUF2624 domain-containing protein [Candidatus Dormibacteraeota bacterium]|nr:DUF2624 domain-containing protein [Candidatus Dormibacteraeota bacterium]